tara:strand:- start:2 stop:541 length:540 start_codon:yes stop_codon:yes gene_type:complete
MACDLTTGRGEVCKSSVGGLKNIYFVNYADITSYTYDSTDTDLVATAVGAGTINAYKYELKGVNTFDQNVTSSRENGTTFVEQNVTLTLKKQDIATHKEIKLLAYGRPRAVIEDYNGNFFLVGLEHGVDVQTVAITSGTVMGDLNGYTLTMQGMEKIPANFIDTANEAGLSAVGLTVVS